MLDVLSFDSVKFLNPKSGLKYLSCELGSDIWHLVEEVNPNSGMATASSAQNSPQEHFLTSSSSTGEDFQLENGKKPVWNNPSNGEVASAVMGAESWPALSESARASPKSAGSITISQVFAIYFNHILFSYLYSS